MNNPAAPTVALDPNAPQPVADPNPPQPVADPNAPPSLIPDPNPPQPAAAQPEGTLSPEEIENLRSRANAFDHLVERAGDEESLLRIIERNSDDDAADVDKLRERMAAHKESAEEIARRLGEDGNLGARTKGAMTRLRKLLDEAGIDAAAAIEELQKAFGSDVAERQQKTLQARAEEMAKVRAAAQRDREVARLEADIRRFSPTEAAYQQGVGVIKEHYERLIAGGMSETAAIVALRHFTPALAAANAQRPADPNPADPNAGLPAELLDYNPVGGYGTSPAPAPAPAATPALNPSADDSGAHYDRFEGMTPAHAEAYINAKRQTISDAHEQPDSGAARLGQILAQVLQQNQQPRAT